MKPPFVSPATVLALALAGAAAAQPPAREVGEQVEAIVTVTAVDPQKKTVTFRGPRGQTATLSVPEARNLDQVKPGSRFKMVYTEAAAVAIEKPGETGGVPSASSGRSVQPAAKGANPGGSVTQISEVTGIIEAIDRKNRYLSIKGPKGDPVSVKVPDDVEDLDRISVGDSIRLTYVQAIAADMIPEPGKQQ